MRSHLEIGGRPWAVSLERLAQNRFRFAVEGRTLEVSAVPTGGGGWSLLLPDGSQHQVAVSGAPATGLTVHLRWGDVAVGLARRRRATSAGVIEASGPARLRAPMPGRVVRVLASKGQSVEAGQGLVVVEAMKMENEVRAPRAGVVAEVLAGDGDSVEAGAVLVVVE